ncbi:MAG TPA: riboflavin biosynthesis protein RibF, partial [Hyphomonas atlantica]|nr:riboflavin biosynthesis protein RibF [Hyphomonas atlantica]
NGRKFGYPTANTSLGELIHPKYGVYAVRVRIDRAGEWLPGVANFGRTPTTGLRDPLLEAHIFDFDGDIYGRWMEVQIISYMRPELHFESLDAMVVQMGKDVIEAKQRLAAA